MATNAYLSEQRIYYGVEPSVFYGFTISTSDSLDSLENLTLEQRDKLVSKVAELYPEVTYPLLVAAMLHFRAMDHSDLFGPKEFREVMLPYDSDDVDMELWEGICYDQEPGSEAG